MYKKFTEYVNRIDDIDKLMKEFIIINRIISNQIKKRRHLNVKILREMSYKLFIISNKIINTQ
jgi:hypothetical protein